MKLKILITLLLLLFVTGIKIDNSDVVATVGNREITKKDFALAYEFAPTSITRLERKNAFNSILKNQINQVLLAEEGNKRGYQNDPALNRIVDFYKRAAIVRELYLKHVRESVEVSEEETRLTYKKMKATLYVKNYTFDNPHEFKKFIEHSGVPHTPLNTDLETIKHDIYGYVDIVHWNDIKSEVEDILFQLEFNELSDPYFDGERYHIFKVIDKEHDSMLTENDFDSKRPTLQKVLRRRKEHTVAFHYIQSLMKPQNLKIKSKTLEKLTDLFWESQKQSGTITRVPTTREILELTSDKNQLKREPIATFVSGEWTVGDFLFNYELNPIEIHYRDKKSVRSELVNVIATLVRDYVLSEQGIEEGLEDNPSVLKEVQYWNEKLLANRVRRNLYSENTYHYDHRLSELLGDLRKNTHIVVDSTALYATETSDMGLSRKIDFVHTLLE